MIIYRKQTKVSDWAMILGLDNIALAFDTVFVNEFVKMYLPPFNYYLKIISWTLRYDSYNLVLKVINILLFP